MWHDHCSLKNKTFKGQFMSILTSKKAIITALSLGSMVLAGTIKDINSRTVRTAQAALELELAPVDRGLASDIVQEKVAVMPVAMNEAGMRKINGEWEITRLVASNEVVVFDKINNPEDSAKTFKMNLDLIDTSTVRANNDNGLIFKISLLNEFDKGLVTIALFKKYKGGYEILEAKRIVKKVKKQELKVDESKVELVLERALNQAKSPKILTGEEASGEMTLTDKTIEGLSIDLKNGNGEDQSVTMASAELQDGGSFKAEIDGEEVAGIVFNNGKDGYRLSFVTGPLAGAMLNFVTRDQMDKIEETKNDSESSEGLVQDGQAVEQAPVEQPAVVEVPMNQEVVQEQVQADDYEKMVQSEEFAQAQEQILSQRAEASANPENQEPVEILNAEQIKETAETQGFAF
jgi:hypothetical protein